MYREQRRRLLASLLSFYVERSNTSILSLSAIWMLPLRYRNRVEPVAHAAARAPVARCQDCHSL